VAVCLKRHPDGDDHRGVDGTEHVRVESERVTKDGRFGTVFDELPSGDVCVRWDEGSPATLEKRSDLTAVMWWDDRP
jgi:hypothetical protein